MSSFLRQPLFATSEDKDILPYKFLWIAILTMYVIANAPPKRLNPIVLQVVQSVPHEWLRGLFQTQDLRTVSYSIVHMVLFPAKKLCFFLALLVIGYPIIRSLRKSAPFWNALGLKRTVWCSFIVFLVLSAIAIPYGNPYGGHHHRNGLSGLGVFFGQMSIAPFASDNEVVYGRLLKPAIANLIHMDGFAWYYLFSLLCTYVLVFLTFTFLESRLSSEVIGNDRTKILNPVGRGIAYVSVMTSSFMMTSFQSPGYSDQVVFILTLLMVCLPMTPQARLGTVALCLVTHEAIALALVPAILFWFPKGEKSRALLVAGLFFAVMAASYGLDLSQAVVGHGSTVDGGSVWNIVMEYPGYFLAGLSFSYKLFWAVFLYVLWRLWVRNEVAASLGLVAVAFFPVSLCLLAWDTTRIGGVGFLAVLIALVILLRDLHTLPKLSSRLALTAICVNMLIPTYNVILYPPVGNGPPVYLNSLSDYPYLGLYRWIYSILH